MAPSLYRISDRVICPLVRMLTWCLQRNSLLVKSGMCLSKESNHQIKKITYIKSAMHVDLAVYLVIAGKLINSGHINALFDLDY